ncbi:angiopoietin-related protein 6-like [Anopheles moucheti]|uniref:angiopoietin-related protein 6-like n=1 Tax=Anopheles moucheti TaxID=186751 RepID=UPI0022F13671|nr:angiopoietin-related protein 6-like [Anopheles moucheti]
MVLYSYFVCLFLAALSTAEQEDLTSNLTADLNMVRLKDIQMHLVQIHNKLNTLSSQMVTLMEQSCDRKTVITDCSEVSSAESGIFPLRLCTEPPYNVYCNQSFEGGGWMVIYNRLEGRNGTFNQTWESYKRGFGHPDGEHFIGLDRLHTITYGASYEIAFLLTANGEEQVGIYDHFEVDNERDHYPIRTLGSARGSMRLFRNNNELHKFQTYDRNNLHPLARATMIEKECAFWFVDMPHSHDSYGFAEFCINLPRLKIMIRKRPSTN